MAHKYNMLHTRSRTFYWRKSEAPDLAMVKTAFWEGWLPADSPPGYYPIPGELAPHDLLEHLSNKSDIEHEFRAFGVSLYSSAGADHLSFKAFKDNIRFEAKTYPNPRPCPQRWSKPLPTFHEARLKTAMYLLKQDGYSKEYIELITPWIRLGYRGAMRVFGADNGLKLHVAYESLVKVTFRPPANAKKLTLSIDMKTMKATAVFNAPPPQRRTHRSFHRHEDLAVE